MHKHLTTPLFRLYKIWIPVILLAIIFLAQTNYVSNSNDSRFYSEQVIKYEKASFHEMLTPKWGNNYGYNPDSYMRDQFPGQLFIGIAVAKLGYPSKHALHALELVFQLASIYIIYLICCEFIDKQEALFIYYGLHLFPMAYTYSLRGNHESGIAFFAFASLYSGLLLSKKTSWNLIGILSSFFLLFIKGPFILFHFIMASIGFLHSKNKKYLPLFLNFFLSIIMAILFLYLFEKIFFEITGESFMKEFYTIQFKTRVLGLKNEHSFLYRKISNLWYYIQHCLTYSVPWLIFLSYSTINKRIKKQQICFINSPLSFLLLLSSFSFCVVFSMSDRIAGRYIHPAYYLFTTWTILATFYNSDFFQVIHIKILSTWFPYIVTLLWSLTFLSHFFV